MGVVPMSVVLVRVVPGSAGRWQSRAMTPEALEATIAACNDLIVARFPAGDDQGAAAMLLADGSIVTGTAPSAANPSVELCHEVEPYCAAYRLAQPIVASVCLHRQPGGRIVVLSPCGSVASGSPCTGRRCSSPSPRPTTPPGRCGSRCERCCPTIG